MEEWWKGDKPKFTHDCSKCFFLGNDLYQSNYSIIADLYYCGNEKGGSVIVRYGDDGPDYESGPLFICLRLAIGRDQSNYKTAILRAIGAGLIPDETLRKALISILK